MFLIDLILVASQYATKNKRMASKKIEADTARIEREDRQIDKLIALREGRSDSSHQWQVTRQPRHRAGAFLCLLHCHSVI